jgi:hypothetical protein
MSKTYKVEGNLDGDIRTYLTLELGFIGSKKVDEFFLITVFNVRDDIETVFEKYGLKVIEVLDCEI